MVVYADATTIFTLGKSMPDPTEQGLTSAQAAERLKRDGPNVLDTKQHRTFMTLLIEVVREPMFLLLIAAGTIYLLMGDLNEALILLGFVVIIMTITVLQERRTERTLIALRDLSSPRALVLRNGEPLRIAGSDVVQDDILILKEGDRIPADATLLTAHELAVDESLLSGESVPVDKFARNGKVFAGTLVTRGQATARVSATGARTALGHIGKFLKNIENEKSPLHEEMTYLTRRLAVIGISLCITLSLLFVLLRGGWLDALLAGITLAMGILPQEFSVIMIVFFAMGARRIAQHNVLTRRLNAIETLGETTVLCVDKTGTLTENRMALVMLSVNGEQLDLRQLKNKEFPETYHTLLEFAVLASEIEPHDPLERAVLHFAGEHLRDTEHLHPQWQLVREYELSPELLAMTHLWRNTPDEHDIIAAKGAPEAIADLCHLNPEQTARVQQDAQQLANQALRVLGVAKGKHRSDIAWPAIQHDFDFEFVGLIGLADPLRPEVPDAVRQCRQAGIRVVMITGDHPQTAAAIASQAGIDGSRVMTGAELNAAAPTEHARLISETCVFARVTPEQKLQIVEALKANHDVVAMTGDGVNDAPALKAAHIGIAMGKRGTDVAREAAALVLLDDRFPAIVEAIQLGRRIYSNLRQALVYTLAVHVPIIGLSIIPLLFGWPLLLSPIHIAFLELVIDPACSVAFEAEPGNERLMQNPPRTREESLLSPYFLALGLLQGTLITLASLATYTLTLQIDDDTALARTLAFCMLVTANAFLILSLRSTAVGWRPMFTHVSPVTLAVLLTTLAVLLGTVCIPPVADLFGFVRPTLGAMLAVIGAGAALLLPFQFSKVILGPFARPARNNVHSIDLS